MNPEVQPTKVDQTWGQVCEAHNKGAFAAWMGLVEIPLRRSLTRWSRSVDVEVVLQETFLRMWLRAFERPELEGRDASLRFAYVMARNVASEEARRSGTGRLIPIGGPEDLPDPPVDPAPVSDHALARIIRLCIEKLPPKPQEALLARLKLGATMSDRDIASSLRMKKNTLLQNIVRARKFLERCLAENEVILEEVLR